MEYRVNKYTTRHAQQPIIANLTFKAALIDMDGVLYDSMKYHTQAWKRLADELNIPATEEEFYLYEGMTGTGIINMLYNRTFGKGVDDAEAKRLYEIKARYFLEIGNVETMPHADRMLNTLKDAGLKCVLVTGSGQASILERVSNDYPDIFDEDKRVTAHDVKNGKPHPEPYLQGMAKVGCVAEQCIVIENAPLGIQAGKAAGCFVIGITTGPIPRDKMFEAGADLVFDSMEQFADALPELLKNSHFSFETSLSQWHKI